LENQEVSKKELKQLSRLRQRADSDPDDQFAVYELVESLVKMGETQEAIKRSRELVKIADISPVVLEAVARFFVDEKLLEEAVFCYERLAALQPKRALSHYCLGRVFQQMGQTA